MDEMPTVMKADFENLMEYSAQVEGTDKTKAFSMYHKFDFVKRKVSYTAGMPTTYTPGDLPRQFFMSKIPPTKIYTVEHIGPHMIILEMHGLRSIRCTEIKKSKEGRTSVHLKHMAIAQKILSQKI